MRLRSHEDRSRRWRRRNELLRFRPNCCGILGLVEGLFLALAFFAL